MKYQKYIALLGVILLAFGVVSILDNTTCEVDRERLTVNGNSLSGLIEAGANITAGFGYYDCYDVDRDDVVILENAANSNPIVKRVQALPGDHFILQETEEGFSILVNGTALTTTNNEQYLIDGASANLLNLYAKDYQNKIPENAYLVLGNHPKGTLDSTRFGLIDKAEIKAKVLRY